MRRLTDRALSRYTPAENGTVLVSANAAVPARRPPGSAIQLSLPGVVRCTSTSWLGSARLHLSSTAVRAAFHSARRHTGGAGGIVSTARAACTAVGGDTLPFVSTAASR